ncbi:hypothetical protein [uncultured Rhodoblastus sp.]|uniref:hypothetical protein n=1 Tax=uncultured Rhodoblastus sp. TaxID=543037 RepID=UPI0025E93B0E|nr:hypothetical protein [uncultured Rhodoblastus sp.]
MKKVFEAVIERFGIYEVWQIALTLAMVLLALVIAKRPVKLFSTVEVWFKSIGDRPFVAILVIVAVEIGLRVALLPLVGIQDPIASDEFSLMLQAKTYLTGHLTNKPSLPPNFTSLSVLLEPTYSSIYPVLRSFPLLAGYIIGVGAFGGVLLSVAALAAAIYWMVRKWLGGGYAFVAALIVILRFGLFSHWVNSYYGGAFTALGGVLLIGAYKSLKSRPAILTAAALGLGVVILMTTRPFEGLCFAAPIVLALGVHFLKSSAAVRKSLAIPGVVASALILGGLGLTFAYNDAVTGDWKLSPYIPYQQTSGLEPLFLFQSLKASSESSARYEGIGLQLGNAINIDGNARSLYSIEATRFKSVYFVFYVGFALLIPFIIGIWALRRETAVLLSGASLVVALAIGTWSLPHYAAPGFGILILAVMSGFRELRTWRPSSLPFGLSLSRTLPLALVIGTAVPLSAAVFGVPALIIDLRHDYCCWIHAQSLHVAVANEIERSAGRNIVIADAGPKIPREPHAEIVVANGPKLEDARTIWINDDPEFNASTIELYSGRRVWRLSWLDKGAPCLQLFQTISSRAGEPLSGSFTSLAGDPGKGWFPAPAEQCPQGLTRAPARRYYRED